MGQLDHFEPKIVELKQYILVYFNEHEKDFENQLREWNILEEITAMLKYVEDLIRFYESDNATLDSVYITITGLIKKIHIYRPQEVTESVEIQDVLYQDLIDRWIDSNHAQQITTQFTSRLIYHIAAYLAMFENSIENL